LGIDFLPDEDNEFNIGSSNYRWNNFFMRGYWRNWEPIEQVRLTPPDEDRIYWEYASTPSPEKGFRVYNDTKEEELFSVDLNRNIRPSLTFADSITTQDVIPREDGKYNLGKSGKKYHKIYADTIVGDMVGDEWEINDNMFIHPQGNFLRLYEASYFDLKDVPIKDTADSEVSIAVNHQLSMEGDKIVNVQQGTADSEVITGGRTLTGGNAIDAIGDLTQDRTISVSSNAIQVDELDESIAPTWTGLHTFDAGWELGDSANAGGNYIYALPKIQNLGGNIDIDADSITTFPVMNVPLDMGSNKVTNIAQATGVDDAVAGGRTLNAGSGLSGTGDLTSDVTFDVNVGNALEISADTIGVSVDGIKADEVDQSVDLGMTAQQTLNGGLITGDNILADADGAYNIGSPSNKFAEVHADSISAASVNVDILDNVSRINTLDNFDMFTSGIKGLTASTVTTHSTNVQFARYGDNVWENVEDADTATEGFGSYYTIWKSSVYFNNTEYEPENRLYAYGGANDYGFRLESANTAGTFLVPLKYSRPNDVLTFDADSVVLTDATDLRLGNNLTAIDGEVIWNEADTYIPIARLQYNKVTVNAGTALVNGGAVQLGDSITIDHEDTSTQGDVTTSGDIVLDDISFDTHGHVIDITTRDISADLDDNYVNVSGDTMEANLGMGGNKITGLAQASASSEAVAGGRTLTAGSGMAAIGDLTQDRTIGIAQDGVTTYELDLGISPTWTGDHTWNGDVTVNISGNALFLDSDNTARNALRFTESGTYKWTFKYGNEDLLLVDDVNASTMINVVQGGKVWFDHGLKVPTDTHYALDVGGDIEYNSGRGNNELDTGGATWAVRDSTNALDVARFNEGGNVEIPNGRLSAGTIDAGAPAGANPIYFDNAIELADDNNKILDETVGVVINFDGTGRVEIRNGPLNFPNSNDIEDAGTVAVSFDGNQNVDIPNGELTTSNIINASGGIDIGGYSYLNGNTLSIVGSPYYAGLENADSVTVTLYKDNDVQNTEYYFKNRETGYVCDVNADGAKNALIVPRSVREMRKESISGRLSESQKIDRITCPAEESADLAYITTYGILRDTGAGTYNYYFPKRFRETTTCKEKDTIVNLTPQEGGSASYEFIRTEEKDEVKGIRIFAKNFNRMDVRVAGARYDLRDRKNYRESLYIN